MCILLQLRLQWPPYQTVIKAYRFLRLASASSLVSHLRPRNSSDYPRHTQLSIFDWCTSAFLNLTARYLASLNCRLNQFMLFVCMCVYSIYASVYVRSYWPYELGGCFEFKSVSLAESSWRMSRHLSFSLSSSLGERQVWESYTLYSGFPVAI